MKHLLEYEDLTGLLGDLEDIGLSKRVQVVVFMEIPNMMKQGKDWETVFLFPIRTAGFWSSGDPKADLNESLKLIGEGKFRFSYPEFKRVADLEAGSPGLWKFLNPGSIRRMAGEGWKDFETFVNALQAESTRLNRQASGFHPSSSTVKVRVFITPPGLMDGLSGGGNFYLKNSKQIPSDHPEVVSFYVKDSL